MDYTNHAWELLGNAAGSYSGKGVNHDGEAYTGKFQLKMEMPAKLLSLLSSAHGEAGEVFHDEISWLGRDLQGELILFVCSNNHPGITPHALHRIEETSEAKNIIFRFGDPKNRESFREEITISLFADGSLAHQYSWGMPGGAFAPRSGSRMLRETI